MQAKDLNLTHNVTGYQRFLFLRLPDGGGDAQLALALEWLGENMENMHDASGEPSAEARQRGRFQYLRAEGSLGSDRDLPNPQISQAEGLVRLEGTAADPLIEFESNMRAILEPRGGCVETLSGVQRPRSYTSYAMTQYAYATALGPGAGDRYPLGVVTPMNKDQAWWDMDWMHRESFFLPRYDVQDNLLAPGHARAAEAGIPHITRRLVHAPNGYGLAEDYDFIGYFEFSEEHAATFRSVMAALRDVSLNPEWKHVLEGPEWWGRRVRNPARLWETG